MGYYFHRFCWIIWLLLAGSACRALNPPKSHRQLQLVYQQLLTRPLATQEDVVSQINKLTGWQREWEQNKFSHDSTFINSLLQLGADYLSLNTSDYPKATRAVQQAVELTRVKRRDVGADQAAKALYRLGMLLSEQNLPAVDVLKKAVQQGRGIRTANPWVSGAYMYLAYAYYSAGDFQQAVNSAENGEQIARATANKMLITKILQEKAKALRMLRQYELARKAAGQAAMMAEKDTFPAVTARAYQLLGAIASDQHQLPEALRYCQRAFQVALPNDPTRPNYAVEVGRLYYELRRYEQAISYFQYGLEKNTNAYARAYSLNQLGLVYWQKKNYDRALRYYQQGLTLMPIGFKNESVTSLPDAQSIRQADQKDYLLNIIQNKADAWLDYAKATGNDPKKLRYALDTYQIANQMIDFMRWEHTGEQSKLFWRQITRGMYERAIETCYLLGDAEQVFRFMEKSRSVMLADKLNELGARQQLTKEQLAEEQKLQQSVSSQQEKLADLSSNNSAAYTGARMALFAKQDSLNDFLKKLETTNPAYYQYKYANATIALADLQQYLKKQSGSLITYFVGDSALYLMAVTGNKAVLKKQSIKAYSEALHQFAGLLANSAAMSKRDDVNRFLGLSNDLYSLLLAPFGLPKGRVLVSPDGFFVPFDALSRSADKADFAVNDYAFSYVYSVGLLLKNGVKRSPNQAFLSTDFLGVAPVEFASRLNQVLLPRSDEALTPIAGRFSTSTLLTHGKATKASFLEKAATARVIHLFTHATADSSDREPSLYFADSTLQLSDLPDGLLPNAELVVLAACKTGIGANQQGEGVFSLARGFAALGVPSVLTTLWSVQNEATYELTDLFYMYLDQGLPKDVALQRAKQDWLSTAEGENQLPNYWAGLLLVGDSKPLVHLSYSPWVGIVCLLALMGLGGIWFWQNRERRATAVFSAAHSA